jgi:hypothetical protein
MAERSGRGAALVVVIAAAVLSLSACATLPEPGGGDKDLPNAGAGPFRALRLEEVGNSRSAPQVLFDRDTFPRDPAVVDLDGDPATLEVAGYFGAVPEGSPPDAPTTGLVRYGAIDGRSFDRAADVVLEPAEAWEGGILGAPSALRFQGEIWLYYAAAGGIGLARSADGRVFTREPDPVLTPDAAGWEQGAVPRSPGVVELWDGSLRMFYEVPGPAGSRIGEARSGDGVLWTRVGEGPALEPAADTEDAYDGASVGAPYPVTALSATGERILRVYYSAASQSDRFAIGLAARFGPDGPLERAISPVFGAGSSLGAREPCALLFNGFSLLFVTQRTDTGEADLAVAAGVAPATAPLPPPNPL